MSKTEDGGPAFPNTVRIDNEEFASLRGMSLRDYFAAKAMQALIGKCVKEVDTDWLCKTSIAIADEMLKARNA